MFDKVLLATDLTEEADGLVHCFYSLCPDVDTEITVAHVFKDKSDADPDSSAYKKVQSRVKAVVAELRRSCAVPVTRRRTSCTAAARFLRS